MMTLDWKLRRPLTWKRRFGIALLLLALFTGQMVSTQAGLLQSLEDFLSLGANTVREIQKLIPMVGDEARGLLQALVTELNGLIDTLSRTYQDNLNITLNSLDVLTRDKLLEVEQVIDRVNRAIQDDILLASAEAKNVIREAREQLALAAASLEENVKNIIVVGGETAVFIIDRAFYDLITLVAIILLAVGLLVFVWSLFRHRIPEGGIGRTLLLIFMVAYVIILGALAFVPQVRAFVMTNTGLGLKQRLEKEELVGQPRLLRIIPSDIVIGQANELQLWGTSLLPAGATPAARVGARSMPIVASSDRQIVLNVASLNSETSGGSRDVVLTYPDGKEARDVVRLIRLTPTPVPPDLTITTFTLSPASPQVRDNVTATITVRNLGGPAGASRLKWLPCADLTQAVAALPVPALGAGEQRTFTLNFAYTSARTCQSLAIIDELNTVAESNEANNQASRSITIRPEPTATPVPPSNKFTITIRTGDRNFAGTDANVFVTLFGTRGDSREFELDTPGRDDFERNQTDIFNVQTSANIGDIVRIRLRHDNSGFAAGWFVDWVRVRNVDTGQVWQFNVNRWLATDEADGRIDLFLTPS